MRKSLAAWCLLLFVLPGCTVNPAVKEPAQPSHNPQSVALQPFTGTLPALYCVDFPDTLHGYVGGAGLILSTRDGGKHWYRVYSGSQPVLHLDFTSARSGWAVLSRGLLRTDDGGRTWIAMHLPSVHDAEGNPLPVTTVDALDGRHGYAVCDNRLWYTADGGRTWHAQLSGRAVQSVAFVSPKMGWAASGRRVWRTTDGGRHWTQVFQAPVDRSVGWTASLAASGVNHAWLLLTTDTGAMNQSPYVVFATPDGGRTWSGILSARMFRTLYPNVTTHEAIDAQSPSMVMAGNAPYFFGSCPACFVWGTVSMTRLAPEGTRWIHQWVSGLTATDTFAVSFADEQHGWLAATDSSGTGEILYTPDGGTQWWPLVPSAPGPIPAKTSTATVRAVSIALADTMASSITPWSMWQDGEVQEKDHSEPFYVIVGSGALDGDTRTPVIEVTSKSASSPANWNLYVCPAAVGRLVITGITARGTLVHLAGNHVQGTFDLATHRWKLVQVPTLAGVTSGVSAAAGRADQGTASPAPGRPNAAGTPVAMPLMGR